MLKCIFGFTTQVAKMNFTCCSLLLCLWILENFKFHVQLTFVYFFWMALVFFFSHLQGLEKTSL